jgi:hypothetical protein
LASGSHLLPLPEVGVGREAALQLDAICKEAGGRGLPQLLDDLAACEHEAVRLGSEQARLQLKQSNLQVRIGRAPVGGVAEGGPDRQVPLPFPFLQSKLP